MAAAAGMAGAVTACDPAPPRAGTAGDAPPFDARDWASVRRQFALARDLAHLSTFVFASHPAPVGAAIEAHRAGLDADPLKNGLAGVGGVRLMTRNDPAASAGVVCCAVDGVGIDEAVARLRGLQVVASATPYNPSHLRFGASIANSEQDVAAALRAVRTLA